MNEYIQALSTESIIAFVSSFLFFVISISIAIYLHRKSRVKKQMKVDSGITSTIIKKNTSIISDEVQILWNDEKINNIYQIETYLKNSGTRDLISDDFLKPITICFGEKVRILKAKVFSSSENSKINWSYKEDEVELNVDVIERKKIIKILLVYTNNKVSPFGIDIAIKDGNAGKKELSEYRAVKALYSDYKSRKFPYNIFIIIFLGSSTLLSAFISIMSSLFPNIYKLPSIFSMVVLIAILISSFIITKIYFSGYKVKNWTEYRSQNYYDELNETIKDIL